MKRKFTSICLMIALITLLALSCVACDVDQAGNTNNPNVSYNPQGLEIFRTDLQLTQEQVLSQIKAEHLRKNNGYLDTDEIVVTVVCNQKPLLDEYVDEYSSAFSSVAEFVRSEQGLEKLAVIKAQQNAMTQKLVSRGLIDGVKCTYNTVLNGIAVQTTYGNLSLIENLDGVEDVILSDTYNKPQSASFDASAIINDVDVYDTGIFNSSSVDFTGKGTAVAILDSGFDMSHSVFQRQPDVEYDDLLINREKIESVLSQTRASEYTTELDLSDVYYSNKIPYSYDYGDKDANVFPYDSDHGTHVAGIIGGKDDVITGVAIDTQLVLMKVFPDLDEGGKTEDILLALEDSLLLGVDAINMSLGSSCGFAREEDGSKINEVYDRLNASGISVLTAASNSYSSGFGGEQGNTNFVTNPDSGTVGSPSTYEACLSVASISGTKSKYLVANDSQVIFFKESNAITGKANDFFKELGITEGMEKTYEYVTVPGSGIEINYKNIDVKGKIALVRRGDNTFEEKALNAKLAGAVACIIYNNIDGDILMSMGKSDHIPTISISKDNGEILASRSSGTITVKYENEAGPFISDFSSWGPTPSLELKPEITAHGGNIKSSVPGGGYDEMSGTSMATPNLCGIVILIRQYLKEKYPEKTWKEISVLTNQMMMSTAGIILNEEGNPYSPRKQGAGLASLKNVVTTNAYLSVDGKDRTKLELFDDPKRTGVYEMQFNVVNISDAVLNYDLSLVGMTESVSTSDSKHVAETPQILGGSREYSVDGDGALEGTRLTVNPGGTASVRVIYTLSNADKNVIDSLFPYGMYVEGFVKLQDVSDVENKVDLNIPFLAFYGDWTQAPMFDKTYYEVETEAHDASIDDEDKLKADYLATTPYGSYYYNYIIPLGTYLYDIDTSLYDPIPATEEHIAISNILGTIDGISAVYAGLLRGAKTMYFSITDKDTGEVVWEHVDYNANKAYSNGGTPIPYYEFLKVKSATLGMRNNSRYEFKMKGLLDYGDGGVSTNVRNSFSFDFVLDDEAPVIKSATYEKVYDKTLKKDRYYVTLTVYDNQYVQSITPIIFTSSSSYTFLTENPIPVYSEKGADNTVKIEITDYLEDIYNDSIIQSALAFSVDDYALNSNIYLCQLPGTKGDFKFTKDGTMDGTDLIILSMYENEVVDLTQYLATSDDRPDGDKDYLKHLVWTSSNENVVEVQEGIVKCVGVGRATVTVKEQMDLKQAVLLVNVKRRENAETASEDCVVAPSAGTCSIEDDFNDATIDSIRFSYFDTLFAYSRAAQTSEIGQTGDRKYLSSMSSISFYPGEQIRLAYDLDPWYVKDNYNVSFSSTNPTVATVDETGKVTALKKGTTTIVLNVEGSTLKARVRVTVKSEFVIENRELIAYKGLGGEVVVPDDEGILYIGAYSFCLYTTDNSVELPEDDFDANKIPATNTTITSIVIPKGVEEIKKYAFYNCTGLKSVTIPESVKYIREFAFYNDSKLDTINVVKDDGTLVTGNALSASKVTVVGRSAFEGCKSLQSIDLSKVYSIGVQGFKDCTSLAYADLTALRNTGKEAFKNCTSLARVETSKDTQWSYGMFVRAGLENVTIKNIGVGIPDFCFAQCANLESVVLENDLISIGKGAFSECTSLVSFDIRGKLDSIGEQAFYASTSLESFVLPDCKTVLGNYCFYKASSLATLVFRAGTKLAKIEGSIFQDTALSTFEVPVANADYASDGNYLTSKDGKTIIFAAVAPEYADLVIPETFDAIADGAFCGAKVTTLTILNANTHIGNFAFANCESLTKVVLPASPGVVVSNHAFNFAKSLASVEGLENVTSIGDYAFANTALTQVSVSANAVCGEGAFFRSKVETVNVGANASFGFGAFQECTALKTVNMPSEGGVHFGQGCFAKDTALANIDLSKTDDTIEAETFYGCTKLSVADLQNVRTIGNYAFANCRALATVNLPCVVSIGEGAFGRYDENGNAPIFTSIELPSTLKTIGDGAFIGCQGLTSIVVPSSVEDMGDFTFAYCMALESVTLPESVVQIGEFAFAGCSALANINLENVRTIKRYAFTKATSLATVNLSSVTEIGEGAFAGSGLVGTLSAPLLESVGNYAFQSASFSSFEAPCLEYIGEAAFSDNALLSTFVLTSNIGYIGSYAFNGCKSLMSFMYARQNGTTTATAQINDYAFIDNGVLYTTLPSGKYELKSVPSAWMNRTLTVKEGTYRIDAYAGNENTYIKEIVLPDSLKRIGSYAFYGYTALNTVEFRSYTAPALENAYNREASLEPTDPGYEKLHDQFDLFGYELYYYNFIDLVGKKKPITMVLPCNEKLEGYDSLVYEVYFGAVADAPRSNYEAMDKNMVDFYEYALKVSEITTVTLADETLVNNAVASYNSITQDPTKYGYDKDEWDELVRKVSNAKAVIEGIKRANASQKVKEVQALIDALPTQFDVADLADIQAVVARMNELSVSDRALLDLTRYNQLRASYDEYRNALDEEIQPVKESQNALGVALAFAVSLSLLSALGVIKRSIM